jgi:hypothetical protein
VVTVAVQAVIGLVVFAVLMLPFLVIRARARRRRYDLLADLERDDAARSTRSPLGFLPAPNLVPTPRTAPRRGPDGRFLPRAPGGTP